MQSVAGWGTQASEVVRDFVNRRWAVAERLGGSICMARCNGVHRFATNCTGAIRSSLRFVWEAPVHILPIRSAVPRALSNPVHAC
jgi:hypothetical protein